MIRESTELQLAARSRLRRVLAEVKPTNVASLQAFRNAGYSRVDTPEAHCVLEALR